MMKVDNNSRTNQFSNDYENVLGKSIAIDKNNALISFDNLLYAPKQSPHHLYLLIDEYDNFANEVLTASRERYESLLQGEGLLKTIFKTIKAAARVGLDRAFITGVSPVVMSDITSGYNVAENIYFAPELNNLCGFSEAEVENIVGQVATHCGYKQQQADEKTLRALPAVSQALADAQTQLNVYPQQLSDIYGDKLKLRSYAVVAISFERLVWTEL